MIMGDTFEDKASGKLQEAVNKEKEGTEKERYVATFSEHWSWMYFTDWDVYSTGENVMVSVEFSAQGNTSFILAL